MCQKRSTTKVNVYEYGTFKTVKVDECLQHLPLLLSLHGLNIVACCCGHGKYPTTIVIRNPHRGHNNHYELLSGVDIPRKKRFYFKDKGGYYYIPEVLEKLKKEKMEEENKKDKDKNIKFFSSVICPHCSSSNISKDVIGIDKNHLVDSEIIMSHNFCWDCKHMWIDYDEEFLETLKETRKKLKQKEKNG